MMSLQRYTFSQRVQAAKKLLYRDECNLMRTDESPPVKPNAVQADDVHCYLHRISTMCCELGDDTGGGGSSSSIISDDEEAGETKETEQRKDSMSSTTRPAGKIHQVDVMSYGIDCTWNLLRHSGGCCT